MKKLSLILFFILIVVGLFGCELSTESVGSGNNTSKSKVEENSKSVVHKVVTKKIEASEFVLEITTPTVVENGDTLKVKAALTYTGDRTINLSHGGPIIRFTFTGSDETYVYEALGYVTELKPGQTIEVEDELQVSKTGKQNLSARTTILEVNGVPIEGVGNEKYIKEYMNERDIELEKSKITLEPIEVLVK